MSIPFLKYETNIGICGKRHLSCIYLIKSNDCRSRERRSYDSHVDSHNPDNLSDRGLSVSQLILANKRGRRDRARVIPRKRMTYLPHNKRPGLVMASSLTIGW